MTTLKTDREDEALKILETTGIKILTSEYGTKIIAPQAINFTSISEFVEIIAQAKHQERLDIQRAVQNIDRGCGTITDIRRMLRQRSEDAINETGK